MEVENAIWHPQAETCTCWHNAIHLSDNEHLEPIRAPLQLSIRPEMILHHFPYHGRRAAACPGRTVGNCPVFQRYRCPVFQRCPEHFQRGPPSCPAPNGGGEVDSNTFARGWGHAFLGGRSGGQRTGLAQGCSGCFPEQGS